MRRGALTQLSRHLRRGAARKLGAWSEAWLIPCSESLRPWDNDRLRESHSDCRDCGARLSRSKVGVLVEMNARTKRRQRWGGSII